MKCHFLVSTSNSDTLSINRQTLKVSSLVRNSCSSSNYCVEEFNITIFGMCVCVCVFAYVYVVEEEGIFSDYKAVSL